MQKSRGFTLLEVMFSGAILSLFLVGFSTVMDQGMQQKQSQQELAWIASQMDNWTISIVHPSSFDSQLSLGQHSMLLDEARFPDTSLNWNVETSGVNKHILFSILQTGNTETRVLHEWSTSVRAL